LVALPACDTEQFLKPLTIIVGANGSGQWPLELRGGSVGWLLQLLLRLPAVDGCG
jgi:hypothetical protein